MSQWKLDTWQVRGQFSCPNLDQMDWERKREEEESKRKREGKCGIFIERNSTFSLEFPAIGPASLDEARSKVAPHGKDNTWVPVSGSFDKLQKGRGFSPTCFTFYLRVM